MVVMFERSVHLTQVAIACLIQRFERIDECLRGVDGGIHVRYPHALSRIGRQVELSLQATIKDCSYCSAEIDPWSSEDLQV